MQNLKTHFRLFPTKPCYLPEDVKFTTWDRQSTVYVKAVEETDDYIECVIETSSFLLTIENLNAQIEDGFFENVDFDKILIRVPDTDNFIPFDIYAYVSNVEFWFNQFGGKK